MLILGIDPGTATTGYGVISFINDSLKVIDYGLIETDKEESAGKRLITINEKLEKLLGRISPDVVVMEKLFFATNAKTAMGVGQAIGVIIYTVTKGGFTLFEYSPGTIKKVVAGNGRADKKEIQKAVRVILGSSVKSRAHQKTHFDNAADGLAVAICHARGVMVNG